MTAPTLFPHDAPHVARQPKTDRLILLRLLQAATLEAIHRQQASVVFVSLDMMLSSSD